MLIAPALALKGKLITPGTEHRKQKGLMLRIYCNFIYQASIPRPLELSKKKRLMLADTVSSGY
jgi:hypothetical protein